MSLMVCCESVVRGSAVLVLKVIPVKASIGTPPTIVADDRGTADALGCDALGCDAGHLDMKGWGLRAPIKDQLVVSACG